MMQLQFFTAGEFGLYQRFLAVGVLEALDRFRFLLGSPVYISPVAGALIRFEAGSPSQHALGRAVDVLTVEIDPQRVFDTAQQAGFTGIGIAPVGVWHPQRLGAHLDIRLGRTPENPARWGYRKDSGVQVTVSIESVLKKIS